MPPRRSVSLWISQRPTPPPRVVGFGLGRFGGGEVNQLTAPFFVNGANTDGAASGNFTGFEISNDGVVSALCENGSARPVFKISTGTKPAPTELRNGNGSFTATAGSGDILLSATGEGGFGVIDGGLSRSDVDLAREISNLSIGPNAYKAAIKVA